MNNKTSIVAVLLSVLCIMTSCLGDDASTEQYDDVAISSFTLGTLKKIVYTKRNGKDSTYTTSASCSSVRFTIDNVNNQIYNVDSLTRGIVTSKALVNVSPKNSGVAYLKSLTSDSLWYISSSDSLDFSVPRTMRVYANDGSWYKDYNVDIRVHQQPKDSVYWCRKTTSDQLAKLSGLHALCYRGSMIAYGTEADGSFAGYTSSIKDGKSWSAMETPFTAAASLVTDGVTLFAYSDGKVYSSSDNTTWTEVGANADIKMLAAANKSVVYAIANDGRMIVSDNGGASWADDAMGNDKTLMPKVDLQTVVTSSTTNSDVVTLHIFGNTGADADSTGVHWSKVIDNSSSAHTQSWEYNAIPKATYHKMPALTNANIIPYANGFVMMGGPGRGTCNASAFSQFHLSQDEGLTWWKDSRFYFPAYFASNFSNFAFAVDSDNYMWLICGESGQVWRGYLTQMIW